MIPTEFDREVVSGAGWRQFCGALEAAGAAVLRATGPQDPFDRAEGWRYLSRLSRIALEMMLECADPDFPVFYSASHDTVKIFAPNPDNDYLNATISGEREYRLWGNRGSVPYLSFGTKANRYAVDGTMASTGELDAGDMHFDADGGFEVIVSRTRRGDNWLPLQADSNMLLVRQTFLDRGSERPAQIHIACDNGPSRPQPLSSAALLRSLQAAAGFVAGTANSLADLSERFASHPNELRADDYAELSQRTGGDPNICYYHGFWRVRADEALVIDTRVPDCVYWNFQLNNYWMESLDYRYFPIAVNKHTARYNDDGSVTLVVAARDPGCGNFIDTAGHDNGTMLLRWVNAASRPRPRCRLVKLASLL